MEPREPRITKETCSEIALFSLAERENSSGRQNARHLRVSWYLLAFT